MTLRLILTRHAKSDWGQPGLDDHDRPLNGRGGRAAGRIGRWLAERGYVPDAALVSTALRAGQTWEALSPAFGRDIPASRNRHLYLSAPDEMLRALHGATAGCVILIAHNPGMGSLAQWLVEDPPQRDEFDRFPTCATLVMDFDASTWEEIGPLTGRVVDFVVPRDLTE